MFFRKKKATVPAALLPPPVKTVICIPGNWKSREELLKLIAVTSKAEYFFVGNILMNAGRKINFEMEVCDRDEKMLQAFRTAGSVNRVDDAFLSAIERHQLVVYLVGEGGSEQRATDIAHAAQAVLNAGGIGIKIESAGMAFTKAQWQELMEGDLTSNLYKMFVIDSITDPDGAVFSCGMHNLGLKDTIVSGEDFQDAVDLIRIFSYYQLVDKPQISAGQTFSIDAEAPMFRIVSEENPPYKGADLFENIFGMWRLERMI